MEGTTIEIKDNIFYINNDAYYKQFKCDLKILYNEYYNGDYPYKTFEQLIKLSISTKTKVYSEITCDNDMYTLKFICPGIINLEIVIIIPITQFNQNKDALRRALEYIPGASSIVEYIDDALKNNSKDCEFNLIDDDMKIFESIELSKIKTLIGIHDIQKYIIDIYGDKRNNMWLRGVKIIFNFNERHVIKDEHLVNTICESNIAACRGTKLDNGHYSVWICSNIPDCTPRIINNHTYLSCKGIITFNRDQFDCIELNSAHVLKLKPDLIGTHVICNMPFKFKNAHSTSKFISISVTIYNGRMYTNRNQSPSKQATMISGALEYILYTRNNILYLQVLGIICKNNNLCNNGQGSWASKNPYTCRIDKFSTLGESQTNSSPYFQYISATTTNLITNKLPVISATYDPINGLYFASHLIVFPLDADLR